MSDLTLNFLNLLIDESIGETGTPHRDFQFINAANTGSTLARIKGIPQVRGGGQLAFDTNDGTGADATTPRMLIDNQGNVGIGTENPGARLDVAGDAKFNGPLIVQGALTASGLEVSGVAKIDGDFSVTGKLTAASLAGDGAGLSNVTPANGSVTSAKLAVDSASLAKVTGGKMVISGDNVGIGTENPGASLDVAGNAKFNGPLNVHGALTASGLEVSGIAKIGGDLSVTGKLTAASFTGDGAGLSNVIPADSSVSTNKLVPSAASLSKVSGGTMVISGGNVGIGIPTAPGFKLDVGDRIRLRQGNSGTAGIWLHQSATDADAAFFGMHADNLIGFFGAFPINHGVGWD